MMIAQFGITLLASLNLAATLESVQLNKGREAISSLGGCYLVDYNYVETESLDPGYTVDKRVYDASRTQHVKEWIYVEELSPTRLWVQHVLFINGNSSATEPAMVMKHEAEDWEYNKAFTYQYARPGLWEVHPVSTQTPMWTRRITHLDDGLRYQCAAPWKFDTHYPEWSCSTYAPIPGRETRDMGRRDYTSLDRTTRILAHGDSWLERQNNIKVVDKDDGTRQPLAKEAGKNWYVRIPDSECQAAQAYMESRYGFWAIVREAWDSVLTGDTNFKEATVANQPPRYSKIFELEAASMSRDLASETARDAIRTQVRDVINAYRVP